MSEANLPKLLRTLKNYEADLLLLPSGRSPQIRVQKSWKIVDEHPELNSNALLFHLRAVLGEKILEDLENGLEVVFESSGERFLLSLQESREGKIFLAERLKAIPENFSRLPEFPEIEKWLGAGRGIFKAGDVTVYAAILKYFSQQRTESAVSLEKLIKYPAKSFMGLVEQKELGEHFENLEEGLEQALKVRPALIGVSEISLNTSDFVKLEKIAGERLVMIL